ncbi:MAG: efflux RND transporter periplasmic adaptor subunit [Sulfurovum sp.]|jgi:RND family efflux transporter MFP subunit|nr:efflux RND transporter periplasmic adaptor subunit [Sulfurovum sp.]
MKTWAKYTIAVLLIAIGGALFYFKAYVPKTTFKTTAPKQGKIEVNVFGIGEVGARDIYPVGSQMGGKILTLLSDQGQWVKKGELLATIDPVDLPQLLEETKIVLQKTIQESTALQKELENLHAQKELALLTYGRYKKLKEQGYVSQAEYDKAKTDLDGIKAQIAATLAHIDSSKSETGRMQKNIEALSEKLSRFHVYAPIDGYVISKDAEVAQTLTPSQTIFRIVDPKTVWIKAYIDERISGKVKTGNPAEIFLRSRNSKPLSGYVARISAMSDAVTQEREVNVAFDTLPIPFYMNEQAEVSVTVETVDDTIKIPLSLLRQYAGHTGVWTAKENRAHFQPLKITVRGEHEAGIAQGLTKESLLIIPDAGKKTLSEGMRIHY